jgi:hypothetical protein
MKAPFEKFRVKFGANSYLYSVEIMSFGLRRHPGSMTKRFERWAQRSQETKKFIEQAIQEKLKREARREG